MLSKSFGILGKSKGKKKSRRSRIRLKARINLKDRYNKASTDEKIAKEKSDSLVKNCLNKFGTNSDYQKAIKTAMVDDATVKTLREKGSERELVKALEKYMESSGIVKTLENKAISEDLAASASVKEFEELHKNTASIKTQLDALNKKISSKKPDKIKKPFFYRNITRT
jgi:hypothetical protein